MHDTENLVRATYRAADVDEDGDGRTLHGHFSVFDNWYEIDSVVEGRFLERIAPGAFDATLSDPSRIKVLFDHGFDPSIGNKPLGTITDVREDEVGAAYTVRLIDTDYNRDFLIPAARAGLLGSSFRFSVTGEEWDRPKESTDHNPEKIAERTITSVDVHEFGPVTFPANPEATAAVRSRTDDFYDRLIEDPKFLARFAERTSLRAAANALDAASAHGQDDVDNTTPSEPGHVRSTRTQAQRRAAIALH